MTESVVDSLYGAKMASNESLVTMAAAGSDYARQELRNRFPECIDELLSMYRAAYAKVEQTDPVVEALKEVKRIVGVSTSQ